MPEELAEVLAGQTNVASWKIHHIADETTTIFDDLFDDLLEELAGSQLFSIAYSFDPHPSQIHTLHRSDHASQAVKGWLSPRPKWSTEILKHTLWTFFW